ncbi:MAG: response regulator [Bacillota bacterium]|nr:response regulator [Bacillota bacterium]
MKRILIVDAAAYMRLTLRIMLERYGCQVVGEADNGWAAVQKCRELIPDIVIMDITMPLLDGVEATKFIKRYSPNVKIMMISASGQESAVEKAILNGAVGFIVNPFNEQQLIESLYTLIDPPNLRLGFQSLT